MKFDLKYENYGVMQNTTFFTVEINKELLMYAKTPNVIQEFIGIVKNQGSATFLAIKFIKDNCTNAQKFQSEMVA